MCKEFKCVFQGYKVQQEGNKSNAGLPHCRQILYRLSNQAKVVLHYSKYTAIIPPTNTLECLCVKVSGTKLGIKKENKDIISVLKELIIKRHRLLLVKR